MIKIMLTAAVFEYVSAGFSSKLLKSSVLCEGYSMLKSALTDFKKAGYRTATILHPSLVEMKPPMEADEIIKTPSTFRPEELLRKLFDSADLSLIIAPESEGVLAQLIEASESTSTLLNSSSEAVSFYSDKFNLNNALLKQGLSAPQTELCVFEEGLESALRAVEELGLPAVFKPADGAGCSGLSFIERLDQIPRALMKFREASKGERYLIQKFISGVHASVSLMCSKRKAQALTLNLQRVYVKGPEEDSLYVGGVVPLIHEQAEEAFELAEASAGLFSGLRGYVGVDMILSDEGPVVVEVNPRLTVSYVGLSRISEFNLAELMVESVMNRSLPKELHVEGCCSFTKLALRDAGVERLKASYGLKDIVCPPFSVEPGVCYSLVASTGSSMLEADEELKMVKKKLQQIGFTVCDV